MGWGLGCLFRMAYWALPRIVQEFSNRRVHETYLLGSPQIGQQPSKRVRLALPSHKQDPDTLDTRAPFTGKSCRPLPSLRICPASMAGDLAIRLAMVDCIQLLTAKSGQGQSLLAHSQNCFWNRKNGLAFLFEKQDSPKPNLKIICTYLSNQYKHPL